MDEKWSWRHPFADEPEGREVHWWVPALIILGTAFVVTVLGFWLI